MKYDKRRQMIYPTGCQCLHSLSFLSLLSLSCLSLLLAPFPLVSSSCVPIFTCSQVRAHFISIVYLQQWQMLSLMCKEAQEETTTTKRQRRQHTNFLSLYAAYILLFLFTGIPATSRGAPSSLLPLLACCSLQELLPSLAVTAFSPQELPALLWN